MVIQSSSDDEEKTSSASSESIEWRPKSKDHKEKSERALLRELEETRRAVQEVREALMSRTVLIGKNWEPKRSVCGTQVIFVTVT